MFAVGVADTVNTDMLEKLSSEPRDEFKNYFRGVDFVDFNQFVDDIQAGACSLGE